MSLLKIASFAGLAAGALVLVCVLALLLFPDPVVNRFVKPRITAAFAEAYPAYSIRLADMNYSIFKNRFGFDSVALEAADSSFAGSMGPFSVSGISWIHLLWGGSLTPRDLANTSVRADNIVLAFPQEQYELRCGALRVSVPDSQMTADSLELHPLAGDEEFFGAMGASEMIDMTVPFSVQTPQWLNYIPLSVTYTKRVGGQFFGMGRNGSTCTASIHLATHMDGEKHFYPAGRTIGQVPLEEWVGPGVIADISELVSDASVYTPEMIEKVVDIHKGDILVIKTGWNKYGWNSPESNEFRYMVKHPGPSPDFSKWATEMQIKWIGVDAVSADHPMNTIMRIWHPKTFAEANSKLIRDFGKDWDQMYPLDDYYQDMHLNLFPKRIVHAENLAGDIATAKGGRYYIGCYLQKAMEAESMWGRFVAFKEGA